MSETKSKVLDVHHHLGSLTFGSFQRNEDKQDFDSDLAARLERMDRAGIDEAILMPVNRYLRPRGVQDNVELNDEITRYRAMAPERFVYSVGVAEPLHGEAGIDEIRRLHDLGFLGISYHTRYQGVSADDPWVLRQIAVLQELGMLPFVHAHADSNMESPTLIANIARAFPGYPILVTDALSSPTQSMHLLQVARDFPNIYLETSCIFNLRLLVRSVSEFGASRFVFGSDTYSHEMVTAITPDIIRTCGIPPDGVAALLRGSFEGLLSQIGRLPS